MLLLRLCKCSAIANPCANSFCACVGCCGAFEKNKYVYVIALVFTEKLISLWVLLV